MREKAWSFSKAVFMLCLILIPLHLLLDFLMSDLVLPRDLTYVYWVTLLFVGFLTGFKAKSHLTALNSILVTAAIVTLLFYLLHNGLRIGKATFVDTLLDIGVPTLGLFFRIVPGAIAGLILRYLWRRGLKGLLEDKGFLKDFW